MAPENGKRIILQIEWSVVSKIRDLNSILALISPVLTLTPQTAPDIYSDIYHLICQILSEYEEDSFLSEAVIYARMLDILSLIGRYQAFASCRFDAGPQKQKEYLDRFLSICNYIDEHCTEDLSLDQVAKTAGFSKYHFTRLFKQFTNTTYYKYLNRKRIDHAMLLLSDPDIPVTEAALQSGFSSLSTFLRVFRSVKQCTPTEFRDMYIHPEKAAEKPQSLLLQVNHAKSAWFLLSIPLEEAYMPMVHPTKPPASSVVYGRRLISSAAHSQPFSDAIHTFAV